MVYENVKYLCSKNGVSITQLEKKLGFGNGTIGKWKNSSPSVENAKAVSDFFNVSIDSLVSESVVKFNE